jgi:hypothetical protein
VRDPLAKLDGLACVAKLDGDAHSVDGDIGRAELGAAP